MAALLQLLEENAFSNALVYDNKYMKQPGFYIKVIEALALILLLNGSPALGDEFFQDAVFEELQNVGIDADDFRHKLKEGDYKGAKGLLEEEKDKTSLSEVEEEVASLIARKVIKRVRSNPKEASAPEETPYVDEYVAPQERDETITKVNLEGKDTVIPLAEIHRTVARTTPVPGEEISPYSAIPKALPGGAALREMTYEPHLDKEALLEAGVKELKRGETIFRVLKVQVKVWARTKSPHRTFAHPHFPSLNMRPQAASLTP